MEAEIIKEAFYLLTDAEAPIREARERREQLAERILMLLIKTLFIEFTPERLVYSAIKTTDLFLETLAEKYKAPSPKG